MNINLGILLTESNSYTLLYKIVDFFRVKYKIVNFFVFTDNPEILNNPNIAYLPTFYMSFYKNPLVLPNMDSYLSYKDFIISNETYVVEESQNSFSLSLSTELK